MVVLTHYNKPVHYHGIQSRLRPPLHHHFLLLICHFHQTQNPFISFGACSAQELQNSLWMKLHTKRTYFHTSEWTQNITCTCTLARYVDETIQELRAANHLTPRSCFINWKPVKMMEMDLSLRMRFYFRWGQKCVLFRAAPITPVENRHQGFTHRGSCNFFLSHLQRCTVS